MVPGYGCHAYNKAKPGDAYLQAVLFIIIVNMLNIYKAWFKQAIQERGRRVNSSQTIQSISHPFCFGSLHYFIFRLPARKNSL
jgi:hypothetical protein